MSSWQAGLLTALFTIGCGHPSASPTPQRPSPGRASAQSSEPRPLTIDASLSPPLEGVLGMPCMAPADVGQLCTLCDRYGRIVGLLLPADLVRTSEHDAARAASPAPQASDPRALKYTVAVGQSMLSAQVFTCPGCERMMGWGVSLALSSLPDLAPALRSELQVSLGWPATPLLDEAALRSTPAGAPSRRPNICRVARSEQKP
jgi:hypothetical protein